MLKRIMTLSALIMAMLGSAQTSVVINEINADNPGGQDTREFIELFAAPNTSLDSLVLVFFDGASGVSYNAIDLDGYSCDNQGFFVAGNALAVNVDLIFNNGIFQNGGDAVALFQADALDFPNGTAPTGVNLVDAQVYGTNDAAATNLITGLTLDILYPGYTQFDETAQTAGTDLTQSRIPDGGTAFNLGAYTLQALTPGTWNQPPCSGGTISTLGGVSFCNNTTAVVEFTTTSTVGQYLYIISDANGTIVSTTLNAFDFNGLSVGNYSVQGFSYSGTLDASTIEVGDLANGVLASPCYSYSTNTVTVSINQCAGCNGATISANGATSTLTVVSNDLADLLTFNNTSTSVTATYNYLLTDVNGGVIALVDGNYDFNTLPTGNYLIHGISFEGNLVGADSIQSISGSICGELSTNSISLNVIVINSVVINEINADNPGGQDTAEFIELYGAPNASLDGLTVVFFDGASGNSYAAYDLDGYSTDNFGFFVLGNANAANVDLVFANGTFQNGADAVAIYIGNATDFPNGTPTTSNNLMDAQVYGTNDAAATNLITGLTLDILYPGYTQFDETAQTAGVDLTQSRIPDGGSPFNLGAYVLQTLTPGTWNLPPCNAGTINWSDSTNTWVSCDFNVGSNGWYVSNSTGQNLYIVTDANGLIIDTTSNASYDFTGYAVGNYQVHVMSYTGSIVAGTASVGNLYSAITSDICAEHATTWLTLTVNMCSGCGAGNITSDAGTQVTIAIDAASDIINLTNTSTSQTDIYVYALTDTSSNFIQWINADYDFNSLTVGSYLVYGLSYEGILTSPAVGAPISTVSATNCSAWTAAPISISAIIINSIVINELNADNPGGPDTAEFIEFYGESNITLDGLTVVLFDGTSGVSYAAYDLDGYTTDANGFFMIGNAGLASSDIVIANATLQNGADAVAIYIGSASDFPNGTAPTPNNLMDAMVYGTADATATNLITGLGLDVMIPGYVQFDETFQQNGIDLTQSRVPDGGPAFINTNVVLQELTPNTFNIVVLGCMDSTACNYNASATVNDNSCGFPGSTCDDGNTNSINDVYNADCVCAGVVPNFGCMDALACNFNPLADVDNGTCIYPGGGCDDGDSTTTVDIIDNNCLCNGMPLMIWGCTDSTACNYNLVANTDDGTCIVPGSSCDDADTLTFNDVITIDCSCIGTVGVLGCTDVQACNYDANANLDNGNCLFVGAVCDDGDSTTSNDVVTADCQCLGTVVGVDEISTLLWNVFPNPAQDVFTVQSTETIEHLIVVDVLGNTILKQENVSQTSIEINATQWNTGVYYLTVLTNKGNYSKAVIIQ